MLRFFLLSYFLIIVCYLCRHDFSSMSHINSKQAQACNTSNEVCNKGVPCALSSAMSSLHCIPSFYYSLSSSTNTRHHAYLTKLGSMLLKSNTTILKICVSMYITKYESKHTNTHTHRFIYIYI